MATARHDLFTEMSLATFDCGNEPAEYRYPVNEVMLKALVCSGKSGTEIAMLCRTTPSTVAHMREAYGV